MHIDAMQNILVSSRKVLVQNKAANGVMRLPIAELALRSDPGPATPVPAGTSSPRTSAESDFSMMTGGVSGFCAHGASAGAIVPQLFA